MVYNDNFKYPARGMREIKKAQGGYFDISPAYMEQAHALILEECQDQPMYVFDEASHEL